MSANGDNSVNNSYNTNTSSSIYSASSSSNSYLGNLTTNKQDKQSEILDYLEKNGKGFRSAQVKYDSELEGKKKEWNRYKLKSKIIRMMQTYKSQSLLKKNKMGCYKLN